VEVKILTGRKLGGKLARMGWGRRKYELRSAKIKQGRKKWEQREGGRWGRGSMGGALGQS